MKTLAIKFHNLAVTLGLIFSAQHALAQTEKSTFELKQDEHILPVEYKSNCPTSQRAIATCLNNNQGVLGCRRGPQVQGLNFSGGYSYIAAVVQCGGAPKVSAQCRQYASHPSLYDYPANVCENRANPTESVSQFKERLSCYGQDVQERVLSTCPQGCGGKPRSLHVCEYTTKEWELYKSCSMSVMASITRERLCPNSGSNVDQELGNPPRISVSGETVFGKNDERMFGVYYKSFDFTIAATRGNKGTYCIYPKGESCVSAFPYEGTTVRLSSPDLPDGTYIVKATSSQNHLSTQQEVTISNTRNNYGLCKTQTGTFCPQSEKETEVFSMCGQTPTGAGWVPQGNGVFHRFTGKSCVQGERSNLSHSIVDTGNNTSPYIGYWKAVDGPEFSPRAPDGPNPPSYFQGRECSAYFTEQKDNTGGRWYCERELASNQGSASKSASCLYFDYTSTRGEKVDKYLNEGAKVTRKIIGKAGISDVLVSQEITCENGKLVDITHSEDKNDQATAQAQSCVFYDYVNLNGQYNEGVINDKQQVTRRIIMGQNLINQTVRCENGQLKQVSLDQSQTGPVAATPPTGGKSCLYYNYTNTNGAYSEGQLPEGQNVDRKIISQINGTNALVNQRITCKNGQLAAVN